MKRTLIYIIIAAGIAVATPRALAAMLHTPYPFAAVTSSSMWPALKEGDLVLIRGIESDADIMVGDVVVYRNERGFTIHRVAAIDGSKVTTKGDANTVADKSIAVNDIIGKTLTINDHPIRIPRLGLISMNIHE